MQFHRLPTAKKNILIINYNYIDRNKINIFFCILKTARKSSFRYCKCQKMSEIPGNCDAGEQLMRNNSLTLWLDIIIMIAQEAMIFM